MFEEKIKEELALGSNLSMIMLVDLLVRHAHDVGASDIHIDPTDKGSIVFNLIGSAWNFLSLLGLFC